MQIRVLGCSGGICRGMATTSILLDKDILIDAGTGVADLTLAEMRAIRHVFLSHSHLDHIASIPLLADSIFDSLIANPITVHALPETIDALQKHVFNSVVWPDFTMLPNEADAVISLQAMQPGATTVIAGRSIEMIAVNHAVPAVGYRVDSDGGSFAFSGDTTTNGGLWQVLNGHADLDLLFIESAFTNRDIALARSARHYCAELLAADLAGLQHQPTICISHLHPGEEATIMRECREAMPGRELRQLRGGDVFQLGKKGSEQ